MKDNNKHRFPKGECPKCGGETTRRNSVAIQPSEQDAGKFVLAVDKHRKPITKKALPRQHRKCPQ